MKKIEKNQKDQRQILEKDAFKGSGTLRDGSKHFCEKQEEILQEIVQQLRSKKGKKVKKSKKIKKEEKKTNPNLNPKGRTPPFRRLTCQEGRGVSF